MKRFFQPAAVLLVLLLMTLCLCLNACEKKQEQQGKVEVIDQKFTIRKDGEFNWTIDASGKVRNTGGVDLKNVKVTGYCRSCGEVLTAGTWYVSDVEKIEGQLDTINFLPSGAEESFSFKEIAFYFNQGGIEPAALPERLEVVVESFEPSEK